MGIKIDPSLQRLWDEFSQWGKNSPQLKNWMEANQSQGYRFVLFLDYDIEGSPDIDLVKFDLNQEEMVYWRNHRRTPFGSLYEQLLNLIKFKWNWQRDLEDLTSDYTLKQKEAETQPWRDHTLKAKWKNYDSKVEGLKSKLENVQDLMGQIDRGIYEIKDIEEFYGWKK